MAASATALEYVQKMYIAYFGRPVAPTGQEYYGSLVDAGNVAALQDDFWNSTESQGLFNQATTEGKVNAIFNQLFGRDAAVSGLTYWTAEINSGRVSLPAAALTILNGAAAADLTAFNAKLAVAEAFTAELDTTAEILAYQSNTDGGRSTLTAVETEAQATAAIATIATTVATVVAGGNTNEGQTFTLTTGIDNVTGTANNDTFTADQTQFAAADTINGGAGTDTLNYIDSGTTGGNVPAAIVSAVEVINVRNVNGTAAVAAVTEAATITFSALAAGATVVVAGVTITGTAIIGDTAAEAQAKFVAAAGGLVGYTLDSQPTSTSVVLKSTTAGNVTDVSNTGTGTVAIAIVQGVAAVTSTGVTDTVNASNFAGATDFNSNLSTNKLVVDNLAAGQKAGMIGNGSLTNGDLDANYGATVTASTINIAGGTKAGAVTVTGAGVTAATVNSTGAANTIGALTGAASTTALTINATTDLTTGAVTNAGAKVTVTGAGKVNLSTNALQSAVKTIDASGNSGGLTVKLSDAVDIAVTGSTGNDTITTNAVLTTGTVNAGDGTDTLDLGTNVAHANTTTLAAKYTNFETLRVNGTFDASLIAGITAVQLSGATNDISKMTAAQAGAVTARANIGNTTLALATDTGTSDVLSLTMGTGTTTAAATTAGALTINGFETLNVKANPGSTSSVGANKTTTIGSFVADKLTAINLTGTAVTLSNAATTKAVTIDASALTGDGAATSVGLTIAGNLVATSTVTGSAVKDVVTLGSAGSTYNTGAGNDTFDATAVSQLRSGATYNTLNGGDGTDTLTITANTIAMVDDDFKNISNIEKVVLDSDGGAGDVTVTTGGWYDASFKAAGSDLTILAANGDAVSFTGGTFTGAQKLTLTTLSDGATTADNVDVLTGSGNDTITVTATSWVGHATTNGHMVINAGAGNDTITVSTGTLLANANAGQLIQITGGAGADTITVTHVNDAALTGNMNFVVAAGDSAKAAFDSITGFLMSDIGGTGGKSSDGLDFGTAAIAATVSATAVSGYTGAELTYAINGTTGEVTFDGSKKADLTVTQVIDILDTVVVNGKTVFWTTAATGGDTYVYNADAAGDSVVKLVGVNADALITTNDATTNNGVFIA